MMTQNARIIAHQQELIHKLSWNNAMGCYTRKGLEHVIWPERCSQAVWLVYFDVDGVHALNKKHRTYAVFDAKIKKVLDAVRSTDVVAGQWNSGDEFLVCMMVDPGQDQTQLDRRQRMDAQGMVDRLITELAAQDLTAVFAIIEVTSYNLEELVKPAADHVLDVKQQRGESR